VPAVVVLRFEPYIQFAGLNVPWRAVGIAAAILLALALAALLTRRSSELRPDDLLYLVVGAIPGAVIGGRLLHALAYLDYYAYQPGLLLDPAYGSLSLVGAVVGGSVTAAAVARMLDAPVREWADTAAAPLLMAIGMGKLSLMLGGGGQGVAFDGPWAVAFAGSGPWLTAGADVAAHPSGAYEGLWALLGVPVVLLLGRWARWRRWWTGESYGPWGQRPGATQLGYGPRTGIATRPAPSGAAAGYLFLAALAWWLAGRFAAAFTWRDEHGLGPFGAEQALSLVALGVLLVVAVIANRREHRSALPEPGEDPAILAAPQPPTTVTVTPVTHTPALPPPPVTESPTQTAPVTDVLHAPADPSDASPFTTVGDPSDASPFTTVGDPSDVAPFTTAADTPQGDEPR
jgi:prolipoprotein diacylglyceryltransferase